MHGSVFTRLLVLLLLFTIAGCRESAQETETPDDYQMTLDVESDSVGETTLLVTLLNAESEPVNDAVIDVKGDMNHAGMVPVLGSSENAPEHGVYRVPFNWTMGGEWILVVTASLPDDTTFSEEFNINITAEDGNMGGMDMEATEEAESALGNVAALAPFIPDCVATEEPQDGDITEDCSIPEEDKGGSFFPPGGG